MKSRSTKQRLKIHQEKPSTMPRDSCHSETENARLRRSIDRIMEEKCGSHTEKQALQQKENLLCKLVEIEMDGNAAAEHASRLKDCLCKLKNEKCLTCSDLNVVTRQKDQLLEKLDTFEETNRSLRQLLRDQRCREEEVQRLTEQKNMLLKKLNDSDSEKTHIHLKLCEKEQEMEELLCQLESEKDLTRVTSDFSKSLECSKTHLQGQLKNREAENSRLSAQIRNLECNEAQQKAEICKLMEEVDELKRRGDKELEALKKATQLQKQKAERCEECVEQLTSQLKGKDAELDEALCAIETWRGRVNKLMCEKSQLEEDIISLSTRVHELIEERQCIEENARKEKECLMDKLQQQCQDNAYIKLEYERLKRMTCEVEQKLNQACGEVQELKASLQQCECLVETYKCQVEQSRQEAVEICMKLELCDREKKQLKEEMKCEVEAMRRKFKCRLEELEQLPEMLKKTECKLQECQEQLVGYEKKNKELSCTISDLRVRVKNWRNSGSSIKMCESRSSCEKRNVCESRSCRDKSCDAAGRMHR